jgi:predicted AAA+ superfamily ATPase
MIVQRTQYLEKIEKLFRIHKAVALLGARQCGKTTLARMYARSLPNQEHIHIFDLENPVDLERLQNPMTLLGQLSGLIVIDEIQRRPELFPILRVLLDDDSLHQRYLLLGSASRDLIKQSSETLAGRIAYEEVYPFSLLEVHDREKLFLRGGFPNSYLAEDDEESSSWRGNYIRTYLEQDIPSLGINIPPVTMRRFWMMLTHYNGGIFNASDLALSMGLSDKTVKHYLDILVGTFMIRQLPPWFANIKKRQVKRPKIYFRDSGIFHYLLGLENAKALLNYPRLGLSWEGFAMEQIINGNRYPSENCYFWGIHEQCELDLLVFHKGQSLGYEFKYMDAPKLTKSMIDSMELLNLDKLFVIYPGNTSYALSEKVEVMPLRFP